jgi:hypothetical protein
MGIPSSVALNSSCDLVPGRQACSILLPVVELRRGDRDINQKLGALLKFSLRGQMYIPPLPDDPQETLGNCIDFERVHQIRTSDLHVAARAASLSLLGWRIFASFSRMVFSRAGANEVTFREALDNRLTRSHSPLAAPEPVPQDPNTPPD